MSFTTATKETLFDSLRTAVGATGHYVRLGAADATEIDAIRKASMRRDNVTGAGLDTADAARVLVKTSDYALPANRRVYVSTDGGTTYTACRIQQVQTLADDIAAIEFDSLNRGATA